MEFLFLSTLLQPGICKSLVHVFFGSIVKPCFTMLTKRIRVLRIKNWKVDSKVFLFTNDYFLHASCGIHNNYECNIKSQKKDISNRAVKLAFIKETCKEAVITLSSLYKLQLSWKYFSCCSNTCVTHIEWLFYPKHICNGDSSKAYN